MYCDSRRDPECKCAHSVRTNTAVHRPRPAGRGRRTFLKEIQLGTFHASSPWWSYGQPDNNQVIFLMPQNFDACCAHAQSKICVVICPPHMSPAGNVCGSAVIGEGLSNFVLLVIRWNSLTPLLRQATCLMPGPHRSGSHQLYSLAVANWSRNNCSRATQAAVLTENTDISKELN